MYEVKLYIAVVTKLLRESMGYHDLSIGDARLAADDGRLYIIVHFYVIEHRASSTISVAIRDDYNRPCM